MANSTPTSVPTIFVIFGATGDLMEKKLAGAFLHLHRQGLLPKQFQLVGFSRRPMTHEEFREHVSKALAANSDATATQRAAFARCCYYSQGNFDEPASYARLAKLLGKSDDEWKTCANKLFYLAVPQEFYPTILRGLAKSGLTEPCSPQEGFTRVLVEKPFGKDLMSAEALDELMAKLFREEQIYRIDHYLGKETVQNILAFRFSNSFFESLWDRRAIERLDIQLLETSGVGGRGGFYDRIGALRDVGQNHLLQLLALFAMENPGSFDPVTLAAARVKVLDALQVFSTDAVESQTLRGQYEGYRQVKEVNLHSNTESYFRLRCFLNTPRFAGVPITLESGKKLDTGLAQATVTFRHATPCLCPPGVHYRNVLRYTIEPNERITTSFWVKKPGLGMVLEEQDFSFDYRNAYPKEHFFDAYEKLLLDAIVGDRMLFVSTPEILASWRFIDPIIRTWMAGRPPLLHYAPGSPDMRRQVLPADRTQTRPVIGFIGLGKMGKGLVLQMAEKGWRVAAYNRHLEKLKEVEADGVMPVTDVDQLIGRLTLPRVVWLMVTAGAAVDELLFGVDGLAKRLGRGDVVIDGGNSNFNDSVRRAKELAKRGIRFLDVGVSGGPAGARRGACLMIGGDSSAYTWLETLFRDLSVAQGYAYLGDAGAGHFAKMVHNGIEYGMMQSLAEGFAVLQESGFSYNFAALAELYNHGSVIESHLVEWLRNAYVSYGPKLADVSGSVAHTGEGEWTVKTAKALGVPVPIIEGSYKFRVKSAKSPSYTGKILSALRNQFGGHEIGKSKVKMQKEKMQGKRKK